MASRIPKTLYGPAQLTNAAATLYTVPSNVRAIVKQISVQNPSGAAVSLTVSVGTDAAAKRIFDAFSVAAAAAGVTANIIDRPVYLPLAAGTVIQGFASSSGVLVILITGDEELSA